MPHEHVISNHPTMLYEITLTCDMNVFRLWGWVSHVISKYTCYQGHLVANPIDFGQILMVERIVDGI